MKPMKARLWLPLVSAWGVALASRSLTRRNSARLRMLDVRIVIHSNNTHLLARFDVSLF